MVKEKGLLGEVLDKWSSKKYGLLFKEVLDPHNNWWEWPLPSMHGSE